MCDDTFVISGPDEDNNIPNESLAKIIFDRLSKENPELVLNVDAITGNVLTCEKLLQESIKVTIILKGLGLTKDDVIAIISENTTNYIVPILAAWCLGIVINPVNPDYKGGELKHALLTTTPKLVLCSERTLATVLRIKNELKFIDHVLLMNSHCDYPKTESLEKLTRSISLNVGSFKPELLEPAEQTAMIFFSSGTTGLPKGVQVTHRNLRETIGSFSHPRYGNVTKEDITIAFLPFFHMFGFSIQLITMVIPMTSIVVNKYKPDLFLKLVQDYKATKLFIVPPIAVFLAKSYLVDNYDISSVKDIISAGAPLGQEMKIQTKKRLDNTPLRDAYGLTETCGACTFQTVDGNIEGVGSLVPGITLKILDTSTKENLGPFAVGEICFKGPMVMKGYIGNASATQESIDDEGFYHSGDLGYYNRDGVIFTTDRISEVMKCKGFQVSPVELETLILTHSSVRECGVIGIPDEIAGKVPLAFVVVQNGASITEEDITKYVAERVCWQKHLRGGVRFINEIPKTLSGKIIRRKLVEIFEMQSS